MGLQLSVFFRRSEITKVTSDENFFNRCNVHSVAYLITHTHTHTHTPTHAHIYINIYINICII